MKKTLYSIAIALILALIIMPYATQAAQVHRVAAGESLSLISRIYGLTMEEIIERNNLTDPDNIFVNQPLILPGDKKPIAYQVQLGDSLYKIAQKFGVSMADLAKENNLNDWSSLFVGQTLKVPASNLQVQPKPKSAYAIPGLVREFPDTFYLKGNSNSNRIALTFDDGPDEKYTPQVLDVLKEYNVPATFFLMGNRAEKYPGVVKRIVDEGHIIGNHSWSHPNLSRVSPSRFVDEIIKTENILNEITGLRTTLMRPPYGAVSKNMIEELKNMDYKVINWSVDSVDWRDQDADQILNNTLPDVTEEAILLFHSAGGEGHSLAATVEVLPELIEILRLQGYTFVTVDELLNIPAYR